MAGGFEVRAAPGQGADLIDWHAPVTATPGHPSPRRRRPPRWRWIARRAYDAGHADGHRAGLDASLRVLQEWRSADGRRLTRIYGNGHCCPPAPDGAT